MALILKPPGTATFGLQASQLQAEMQNQSIKNRVALVSGANRGIGAAIAVALARAGADVEFGCEKMGLSFDKSPLSAAEFNAACAVLRRSKMRHALFFAVTGVKGAAI
jgi:hypothetical protein